jgi:hypothetical protein
MGDRRHGREGGVGGDEDGADGCGGSGKYRVEAAEPLISGEESQPLPQVRLLDQQQRRE